MECPGEMWDLRPVEEVEIAGLVNIQKTMERSTIFHGNTHDISEEEEDKQERVFSIIGKSRLDFAEDDATFPDNSVYKNIPLPFVQLASGKPVPQLRSGDSILEAPKMQWLDEVRLTATPNNLLHDSVAEARAVGAFSLKVGLFVETLMWREEKYRPTAKDLSDLVSLVVSFAY